MKSLPRIGDGRWPSNDRVSHLLLCSQSLADLGRSWQQDLSTATRIFSTRMRFWAKRGLSLTEVILAMALASILLSVGFFSLHSSRATTQSRGVADMVAAEFRSARALALSSQIPVAVAFPTENGTSGCASSVALLQGIQNPCQVRLTHFTSEAPDARVFSGVWPVTSGSFVLESATDGQRRLNVANWGGGKDNLYVFTPWGSVLSNDRPMYNGCYCLVVGAGISEQPGLAPSGTPNMPVGSAPGYFALTRVAKPFTIMLSPSGGVAVEPGLPNAAGVEILDRAYDSPGKTAVSTGPAGSVGHAPAIDDVQFDPPAGLGVPGGVNTTIGPGGVVTLRTYASDADPGAVLTCRWRSGPGPAGEFSAPDERRMTWDPQSGKFFSVWNWRPDPDQSQGQVYLLFCDVTDERGLTATTEGTSLALSFSQSTEDRIYFRQGGKLVSINPDGCDFRTVYKDAPLYSGYDSCLSPDGTKILLDTGDVLFGNRVLNLMNRDGSGMTALGAVGSRSCSPVFRPAGNQIYFWSDAVGPFELWRSNADGTGVVQLTTGASASLGSLWSPAVSPDGQTLAFFSSTGIKTVDLTQPFPQNPPVLPVPVGAPTYCLEFDPMSAADPALVFFDSGIAYTVRLSAPGVRTQLFDPGPGLSVPTFRFNRSGSKMVFLDNLSKRYLIWERSSNTVKSIFQQPFLGMGNSARPVW